jgi:hypothetical protein
LQRYGAAGAGLAGSGGTHGEDWLRRQNAVTGILAAK